jgi:hypothetical protein
LRRLPYQAASLFAGYARVTYFIPRCCSNGECAKCEQASSRILRTIWHHNLLLASPLYVEHIESETGPT